MAMSEQTLKRIFQLAVVAVSIFVLFYLSVLFFDILVLLTISFLIAMIFNPVVYWMEKRGIPRLAAVLIVFVFNGVILFFALSILIPKVVSQAQTLTEAFNQNNVTASIASLEEQINNFFPFIDTTELANRLTTVVSDLFFKSIDNLSSIVTSIVSIVAISVIVPFMTFFLLKDNKRIIKGIISIVPNKYLEVSYSIIKSINIQLGRFVRGWILDAFFVGFTAGVGLAILGIQNAAVIGLIAGIGHLIPYFGPVIGGLPAIIISLIQFGDLSMLFPISMLFLVIYSLDNGFVQPNVFSKVTDIHPLLIIILILAGSQVMGILGMLLAVPIATVLKTAAREIYNGYKNYNIIKV